MDHGNLFDRFPEFLKSDNSTSGDTSSTFRIVLNENEGEHSSVEGQFNENFQLISSGSLIKETSTEEPTWNRVNEKREELKDQMKFMESIDDALDMIESSIASSPALGSPALTPLFPTAIDGQRASTSVLSYGVFDNRQSAKCSLPKKKKETLTLGKRIRNLWAGKIYLQSVCGIDPKSNVRVSDVLNKAVSTIKSLESGYLARDQEMKQLVSKQASLLHRIAHYKKLYFSN